MTDPSVFEAINENREGFDALVKCAIALAGLAEKMVQHISALELAARQLWVSDREIRDMIEELNRKI